MRAHRIFSARNLQVAVLIVFLLVPIVGCDDDTMSPCYDCVSVVEDGNATDVIERRFAVGDAAVVSVSNFTGGVTYRIGDAGAVRVVAIRRASRRSDLERIEVSMLAHDNGIDISTDNPLDIKKGSVDLEITAPASAIPRIHTGVGGIDYRGRPTGACRFETGVGSIRLKVPADVNITVDLSAGAGSIFVAFPLDGWVNNGPTAVRGKIGHGGEANLQAHAAVGNIYLVRG